MSSNWDKAHVKQMLKQIFPIENVTDVQLAQLLRLISVAYGGTLEKKIGNAKQRLFTRNDLVEIVGISSFRLGGIEQHLAHLSKKIIGGNNIE